MLKMKLWNSCISSQSEIKSLSSIRRLSKQKCSSNYCVVSFCREKFLATFDASCGGGGGGGDSNEVENDSRGLWWALRRPHSITSLCVRAKNRTLFFYRKNTKRGKKYVKKERKIFARLRNIGRIESSCDRLKCETVKNEFVDARTRPNWSVGKCEREKSLVPAWQKLCETWNSEMLNLTLMLLVRNVSKFHLISSSTLFHLRVRSFSVYFFCLLFVSIRRIVYVPHTEN